MNTWSAFTHWAAEARRMSRDGLFGTGQTRRLEQIIERGKVRYLERVQAGRAVEPLVFDREIGDLAALFAER